MKATSIAALLLAAIPILALAAGPAQAQEAAAVAAPAPYQVIRLGDNQMTCEALIGEINLINGEMQAQQQAMSQRTTEMTRSAMRAGRGAGGGGMGAAMSLGSLAASFVPGASLVVSAASQVASAAQMAQAQAAQNTAMDDMEAMTAEMTDSANALMGPSQRVEHLGEISRAKSC